MSEKKHHVSYLTVPEFFRLDWCCRNLFAAFGEYPYLVGSVLERSNYRDVDLRLMMPDERFSAMFPNKYSLMFLNAAVSDWLKERTGLPIDFQFQDTTKANAEHQGNRNPMGIRAESFRSDEP